MERLPKPRNPVARAVRRLRPRVKPSAKRYVRRPRIKQAQG
jgi:hypothetical protein